MTQNQLYPTPSQAAVPEAVSRQRIRLPLSTNGTLLFLFYILLVVVLSVAAPQFHTYHNVVSVISQASILGIVAIGQTFAIVSGGFDISVGGMVPLAAVLFAILSNSGMGLVGALFTTLTVGAAVGVVNAALTMVVKINPFIATLGTFSVTGGLALALANGQTIAMAHVEDAALGDQFGNQIPYSALLFIGAALVGAGVLRSTVFGRSVYSLGGNRDTARLAGIPVGLIGTGAYVICSVLAALGGIVSASQLAAGSPTTGSDLALTSIAAVIVGGASLSGGVGGVPGTLLGVLIIGTLSDGFALLSVPSFYQQIATGVILILAVTMNQLRSRLHRRPAHRPVDVGDGIDRERQVA